MPDLSPEALQLKDAIFSDRRDEVRALLDRGLSVNTRLSATQTPLTLAIGEAHWSLAEELVERGADPNQKVTPYYSCLSWAGMCLQRGLVEKLLERIPDSQLRASKDEPLKWAIRCEIEAAVDRLIAAGVPLDSSDAAGYSPLHVAALQSNPAMVQKLLKARPQLALALNRQAQNPLHLAAALPNAENRAIIQALVAGGVAVDQRDRLGQTPVVLAAAHNTQAVLDTLLATGAEFSQADRALALKLAIEANRPEQVGRLMSQFDLQAVLDEKHPLVVAIARKRWPMVDVLLRCGIDPESRLANGGEALLPWSMQQFLPELARALLLAGATTGREQVMDWLDNVLLMRKLGKVRLASGSCPTEQAIDGRLLVALQQNIESLGFVLSAELAQRVLTLSLDELRGFHDWLIPCLRAMVGATKAYKPMYPNFPDQVREASSLELSLNAVWHYWGDVIGRRILPGYSKDPRPSLTEKSALKTVGLAGDEDLSLVLRLLLEARGALTPEDKENLTWFLYSRGNAVGKDLPDSVPFRENAALLAAGLLRFTGLHGQALGYLKTAVDVLRTACAYSGGDVSLAESTRFSAFSKSLRRWFLAGLEADSNLGESLWRHPEPFKRLAERLHPGEFRKRFPRSWEAFRRLRSGDKPETFGSQIEGQLSQGAIEACLPLLKSRPGEFARRLDHLLRLSGSETHSIVSAFAQVVSQLPGPLLLQLRTHFQARPRGSALRVVFPKGNLGKLRVLNNELVPLDDALCSQVEGMCRQALLDRFAQRPPLGPCWLDERLRAYTVPFALRSAAKSLHTVARGSRIPFAVEAETSGGPREAMRFFIFWRDGRSRTDLDLSALVLDSDFKFQTALAYYNLKEMGGYHSGDITSAPEGASEFIDIEIPAFVKRGSRYVMMVVSSYTTQPYCDLPECFAGFMRRNCPASGEIYEPRTVKNKFDLTANTTIAIPLILDLHQREVIWTDLALKRNPSSVNNVHENRSSLSLMCEAMVNLNRPSLYDLFELHIEARGQLAAQREKAQTVFLAETAAGAISPYDILHIMSEYL